MDSPAADPEGKWWPDEEPEPKPDRSGAIIRAFVVVLIAAAVVAGLCLVGIVVTR